MSDEGMMRIASAPVSFGVDEVLDDDAWMPAPADVLGWMAAVGYTGTEMGPPGYLGDADELCGRLERLGLEMVGAFLPLHFSRHERMEDDLAWLDENLEHLAASSPATSRPLAVLSEAIDEPVRTAFTGRVADQPEAVLDADRWDALVDNLHRAAERCRARDIEPVIHPHAGTYLETAAEIDRLIDRIDTSLVGLCLDSGHFRYGDADPVQAALDYGSAVRHVHAKDVRASVRDAVSERGGDLATAVREGVFCPFGAGDVDLAGLVDALGRIGYEGWVVVEQDQFLGPTMSPAELVAGQAANLGYLIGLGA